MTDERKTISIQQAMEKVGVSRRTIYNWMEAKRIEVVRTPSGLVRVFLDSLLKNGEPARKWRHRPKGSPPFKVRLDYFRLSGKWYAEGTYRSEKGQLYEIWEEVRNMQEDRSLPGLRNGHSLYVVSVDVPSHPHRHPGLIVPAELRNFALQLESKIEP